MDYKISEREHRVFELLKVNQKMLVVLFKFALRNNSRKWAIERDWRDIEAAVEKYISQEKYLQSGHKESIDVVGDIQLEITTKACPSYMSKIFKVSSQIINDYMLFIFVSYGRLQEQEEEAQVKGQRNIIPFPISSVKFDEEVNVPRGEIVKPMSATYTPNKTDRTLSGAAKQYMATKSKRHTTTDIIPESSEYPVTPVRNIPVAKRKSCFSSSTQVPSRKYPRSRSVTRMIPMKTVLPRQEKSKDLFGLNNMESDVEVRETSGKKIIHKTPVGEEEKKEKIVLSELLNMKTEESECDTRNLKIMSPTEMKKKCLKKKKESTKTKIKSPIMKKNCRHMTIEGLLSSFKLVEEEMDKAISLFIKNGVIPKIKEFHFTRYVDLTTTEQINALLDFLAKHYETQLVENHIDYGRVTTMFLEYVVPVWIIHVFMQEYEMNHDEVIKYFIECDFKAVL